MAWRLGLDVGTNSIGWAALSLSGSNDSREPNAIISAGVRISPDGRNPKDGQSNAVARRIPRQQRRMRDRYLQRRNDFMQALIQFGLMPEDIDERKRLEKIDPWLLRVKGLDKELSAYELGRALFHLQQRRGFKSNRKVDKKDEKETGKIKSAETTLRLRMEETGARTLGEYLGHSRIKNGEIDHKAGANSVVRARLIGAGAKAFYDFYPTRQMIENEFQALWDKQKSFNKNVLTDTARDKLQDILFFQRELKPQPVGKCSLNPSEERAPRALPTTQRLRIYQEVNNLRIHQAGKGARQLTLEERNILVQKALSVAKLTFDSARKALKLPHAARFNLETEKRKHIDGDQTASILVKSWGKDWRSLPLSEQDQLVEKLLTEECESELRDMLTARYDISEQRADEVIAARLPEGYGSLGRTAGARVLTELENDVMTFDQAVRAAGFDGHSSLDFDGQILEELPFYGEVLPRHVTFGTSDPADIGEKRFGKLANPTVHVVLNQLRRVVNDLIKRFGLPEEIVVELARELPLSAEGKRKLERTQKQNQDSNDKRRGTLASLGQTDNYENRLRLRLWEELNPENPLDRRCPYTGEQISRSRLFSDQVEIEHILPFSRTLDNSPANKTLSMRIANRVKADKTPYEAFSSSPDSFNWPEIVSRAANFPSNKSWRFNPDAMERYDNEERDFLARQLVDTQYISRLATLYLQYTGADVWVTPGRLTSDLRWVWGLGSVLSGADGQDSIGHVKNRMDHRHHAVDAIVVALTDRRMLQRVATTAAKAEQHFDKRLLSGLEMPWPGFYEEVLKTTQEIIVSHKPDHGVQGRLHNDTAYGVIRQASLDEVSEVVHRVPLLNLSQKQVNQIRDPLIRERLKAATQGLSGSDFTKALVEAGDAMNPPVRKVRICESLKVIPTVIGDDGKVIKAYKGDSNYCYDIYRQGNGKWAGRVVSRFEANSSDFKPEIRTLVDGTPLIMRLRVNDMIALGEDRKSGRVMRVVKLSEGKVVLADHFEAGSLKSRNADRDDSFKYLTKSPEALRKLCARTVHVTPSGKVFDPGPIQ